MIAAGLIVEAEPVVREVLEASLRELLREHGVQLNGIQVRRT
jgi:hypothetical protein